MTIDWQPIGEMPDEMRDGRPVLLWVSWTPARERYPAGFADQQDEPVTARWYRPGGGDRGYWALIQTGGYADDDDVSGEIAHFAEIAAPR